MTASPLERGSVSLRLYPHDRPAEEQLEHLRHQAALAATVGFDGVMVSEHHADFPGYLPNPTQLAGLLLEAMPRGWAAPCPLLLPIKPYALVVEELAWLAAAHPGRVGAGFAAGALPVDFELAEVPFAEIVDRFKAALAPTVAALRGDAPGPLGRDRAVRRLATHPLPMAVAAQSPGAVRRAAALDLAVLYDSLQTPEVSHRLGRVHTDAGGTGARILIRRLWVGDPPTDAMAAQMAHYRSYAPDRAVANWGDDDQLIAGRTIDELVERVAATMAASACDTLNVRIHVRGLEPDVVVDQIACYEGAVESLRQVVAP